MNIPFYNLDLIATSEGWRYLSIGCTYVPRIFATSTNTSMAKCWERASGCTDQTESVGIHNDTDLTRRGDHDFVLHFYKVFVRNGFFPKGDGDIDSYCVMPSRSAPATISEGFVWCIPSGTSVFRAIGSYQN